MASFYVNIRSFLSKVEHRWSTELLFPSMIYLAAVIGVTAGHFPTHSHAVSLRLMLDVHC